jgi:hypothetical protein
MLFCIGSIVCIIVLFIVANHFWNLLCFLLCPCWKRTDAGSNFVVMSSKFVFSLFGFCSGADWFCIVRRESPWGYWLGDVVFFFVAGCRCFRFGAGVLLFSFWKTIAVLLSFVELLLSTAILFVLVTGSVHFCVEAIEQVHTYVLPFWLHSRLFPLHQACDLFHFPL